ncbi:hypothetical protein [Fusicatenibacter sp.]|uniref:hypothetical protein n=1 Tax=Fusicatenibacter sp. TaxID=2773922 RepID=UPI00399A2902
MSKALTPFSPSSWEKSSNILFWNASLIPNAFPGGIDKVTLDAFTAIAVHSDMKRTGYLSCSNDSLNKLFSNIIWAGPAMPRSLSVLPALIMMLKNSIQNGWLIWLRISRKTVMSAM